MEENIESGKKSTGILFILLIAALVIIGYMSLKITQKNKLINECSNNRLELEADMAGMNDMMSGYVGNMSNDLRKDFQQMLNTYDALKTKDSSQNKSIEQQKQKIQGLMNQLNSNKKLSAQELFTLRKENETLRNIMKGYVKQIDSLNTLNVRLSSDLDVKTQELTTTTTERDHYKVQAQESAEQVKKGSKLQLFGITSTGLRLKLNNTTEPTSKSRNCIQMKSSFTVASNPLTKSGRKVIYMQITSPDGNVLQGKENFVVSTEIGTVAYSDKKEIDYNNENLDVVIYYDVKEGEATKGNYKVKMFCEGQLIGSDSFTLK
ncbi:MAG: hypothetical protein EB100_00930 [Crocinitomicaceae bacterium]|nr:hypothetical protein [Crocinitomicaceae bacterium]